jgi:hypothetical protein
MKKQFNLHKLFLGLKHLSCQALSHLDCEFSIRRRELSIPLDFLVERVLSLFRVDSTRILRDFRVRETCAFEILAVFLLCEVSSQLSLRLAENDFGGSFGVSTALGEKVVIGLWRVSVKCAFPLFWGESEEFLDWERKRGKLELMFESCAAWFACSGCLVWGIGMEWDGGFKDKTSGFWDGGEV